MAPTLTAGFSAKVHADTVQPEGIDRNPILQVLSVKKINATSTTDRYRIILSDGQYFSQAMLATQLNDLIMDQTLDKNVVVRLTQYVTNAVQNRKLVIILGVEVVPHNGEKIGDPINIEKIDEQGGAPALQASRGPTGGVKQEPTRAVARAPARTGSGAMNGPIFPIEALSPYSNKWTIKARVAQKSDVKHYSNQRGEGKLFNVTFIDESGEIRATGFNEAVDGLYEILQEGKVYFVSKARVNIAKKQFSTVKNDYEITFERETAVEECEDASVPQVKFDFKRVDELADVNKDEICDIIGIVREVNEVSSITSKASNKPFAKRDIQLVDQSGHSVRLTLWGKQAEQFAHEDNPVIAFKGVKVGDFGGRSLSMFSSATMSVNPDIVEAHALKGWWDSGGSNADFVAYSNSSVTRAEAPGGVRMDELKTLGQVKDESLGLQDKTDYFSTSGTVVWIKNETFSYPACANPDGCNKKVVEGTAGWECAKCDKSWPEPIHRYILNINILDHTSGIWATAFNDTAETVLGISANELIKLRDSGEESQFQSYFQRATGRSFSFAMMAKQDSFNDQPRVRYNCRKIAPPDYVAESKLLAAQIEQIRV